MTLGTETGRIVTIDPDYLLDWQTRLSSTLNNAGREHRPIRAVIADVMAEMGACCDVLGGALELRADRLTEWSVLLRRAHVQLDRSNPSAGVLRAIAGEIADVIDACRP